MPLRHHDRLRPPARLRRPSLPAPRPAEHPARIGLAVIMARIIFVRAEHQRLWRQHHSGLAKVLDHRIAQVQAGQQVLVEAVLLHPVAHPPAAGRPRPFGRAAFMLLPEIQGRNAIDRRGLRSLKRLIDRLALVHRIAQPALGRLDGLIGRLHGGQRALVGGHDGRQHRIELRVLDHRNIARQPDTALADISQLAHRLEHVEPEFVPDAFRESFMASWRVSSWRQSSQVIARAAVTSSPSPPTRKVSKYVPLIISHPIW